jgi:hypothetical protein
LLVGVAEGTTDGLWEANLLAWFEEVLASEDVFWSELTEVFRGRNLTWKEGGGEAGSLLHTATVSDWSPRRLDPRRLAPLGSWNIRVREWSKQTYCS